MGQKINPHGLRVGVIKNWDSRWYVADKDFGDTLVEDYKLRTMLKKKYYGAGIPKIEIERDNDKVRVHIHCAKPGMIIGKGGATGLIEIDNALLCPFAEYPQGAKLVVQIGQADARQLAETHPTVEE